MLTKILTKKVFPIFAPKQGQPAKHCKNPLGPILGAERAVLGGFCQFCRNFVSSNVASQLERAEGVPNIVNFVNFVLKGNFRPFFLSWSPFLGSGLYPPLTKLTKLTKIENALSLEGYPTEWVGFKAKTKLRFDSRRPNTNGNPKATWMARAARP